jgi:endogenous inhibitor of DNA gyrase (YacG/DUF329 family)
MTKLTSSSATVYRIVSCPACKGDSIYGTANPFRPFCSERCKNADFGAWASESYRLQAKPPAQEDHAPDASNDGVE